MASTAKLIEGVLCLEDGTIFRGYSFGHPQAKSGEVVFCTGMVGYPESLTDPSYYGQILVLTYPLIGNYGVPDDTVKEKISQNFESERIQASGLIVSHYSPEYHHWNAEKSLGTWLQKYGVPALYGIDTRALTKKLREHGTMMGHIEFQGKELTQSYSYPDNLVEQVSCREPEIYRNGTSKYRILLYDCGCKHTIIREFLNRDATVIRVPWDYDLQAMEFDGLFISNGPGDPKECKKTIEQVRRVIEKNVPIFGICLGHQILALAAGADTYKLPFGHRSQNQPVMDVTTKSCFITSQNHGYAVDTESLPQGWHNWFINLNDKTSEGLLHESKRFMSVQFHPEASPGPVDTTFLFNVFQEMVQS